VRVRHDLSDVRLVVSLLLSDYLCYFIRVVLGDVRY